MDRYDVRTHSLKHTKTRQSQPFLQTGGRNSFAFGSQDVPVKGTFTRN